MSYQIVLDESPDEADKHSIREGLERFNESHVRPSNWQPFAVLLRDDDNAIVGGLVGGTYWGWLYVESFWIAEEARHHGYGSRILTMAEAKAIERGCAYALLDTMSFQALPFYERHGYSVYGVLEDMPAGSGHRRYWLRKTLHAQD